MAEGFCKGLIKDKILLYQQDKVLVGEMQRNLTNDIHRVTGSYSVNVIRNHYSQRTIDKKEHHRNDFLCGSQISLWNFARLY
jgi:hypothetical protein